MTLDLFSADDKHCYTDFNLGNASLRYYPNFFCLAEADFYLRELSTQLAWRQEYIEMYGVRRPIPRLSAWYADPDISYEYSGIGADALSWTKALSSIRAEVETCSGERFNGVLANLYRDGQDSVSWHSDDETSLGADPIVASVSFGATRRFQLRPKHGEKKSIQMDLAHGSLLLMLSGTQLNWQHQVPKTRREVDPRINLTFRYVSA